MAVANDFESLARSGEQTRPGDRNGAESAQSKRPALSDDARDPRKPKRRTWFWLIGILLAATPPLVIAVHRPALYDTHETDAVHRSIATWNYHASNEGEDVFATESDWWTDFSQRLVPYVNGEPVLDAPPMTTWLHELTFASMPDRMIETDAQVRDAIVRSRAASIALSLLLIAAVFWAGYSIGGATTAAYAGIVCAASVTLILQGRLASGATAYCAFAMFSLAGALWAIRPLRSRSAFIRLIGGWSICGIGLGAATLTAGPSGGPLITFALLLFAFICPNRPVNLIGVVAAHCVAAIVLMPWAVLVHDFDPDIWSRWLGQIFVYEPTSEAFFNVAMSRSTTILLGLAPWTIWVVAGIVQPFSKSSEGSRQQHFIPWSWFILTFALLLLLRGPSSFGAADARNQTDTASMTGLLMIVPVTAILLGELFHHFTRLSLENKTARIWRIFAGLHILAMFIVSLALFAAPAIQDQLIARHVIEIEFLSDPGRLFWILSGIVSVAIAAVSIHLYLKRSPTRLVAAWAVWSIVVMSMLIVPVSTSHSRQRVASPNARITNVGQLSLQR